jgi:hypothetical protein
MVDPPTQRHGRPAVSPTAVRLIAAAVGHHVTMTSGTSGDRTGSLVTVVERGLGPFVTERTATRADGTLARWQSRLARKRARHPDESTWWAPGALGWWIAVLFAIGSACFAVAAVPSLATAVGAETDNLIYFVGSIFFTTAGLLLYAEVVGVHDVGIGGFGARCRRLLTFQPHRIDWLAAVIQSVGTVFFNVSTGHAFFGSFDSATSANHAIWRPDVLGSICFLVSSYLSYAEVCHGVARWQPTNLSWWITIGNLLGSVAFGVSAVASRFVTADELRNPTWTTLGTFIGGLCFLGASILLLPERTEAAARAEALTPVGGAPLP